MPNKFLPNVRLNIYHEPNDAMVTITVKPGERIEWAWGGPTDEGYCHCHKSYEYDTDALGIVCEYDEEASDCDGPLDRHSDCFLSLMDIFAKNERGCFHRTVIGESADLPWQRKKAWQRDYNAEMAGY